MLLTLKRLLPAITTVFLLSFSSTAWAAKEVPFTQEKFEQLQNDGQVVLVDVYASWCGTCMQQQAALKKYVKKHSDRDLHILKVNFDTQKDVVKMLKAPRQSTLVLYKGTEQVWFSVAETRPRVITRKIEEAFKS